MIYQDKLSVKTRGHRDIHDITGPVSKIVNESGITAGTVHIFNVGSTGSIGTIELEAGLAVDLPAILDKLMPPSRSYGHEKAWHDGNGHSHLQATLLGPELTVPRSRRMSGAWDMAADLSSGMRYQAPDSRYCCNSKRRIVPYAWRLETALGPRSMRGEDLPDESGCSIIDHENGASSRARTEDLVITNHLLYQLS